MLLCHVIFFWKLLYERIFAKGRGVRGFFVENRHVAFFWKLSAESVCDILLKQMLERTRDVWKGLNMTQKTDSEQQSVMTL